MVRTVLRGLTSLFSFLRKARLWQRILLLRSRCLMTRSKILILVLLIGNRFRSLNYTSPIRARAVQNFWVSSLFALDLLIWGRVLLCLR